MPCLECGRAWPQGVSPRRFCSTKCTNDWNNRRLKRGAILYDLLMTWRLDRSKGKALNLWTLICRAVNDWKEEDDKERDGRRSWRDAEKVIAENPIFLAHKGRI